MTEPLTMNHTLSKNDFIQAVTPKEAKMIDDLNPFNAAEFAFPLKFGCQNKVTGLFKTQLADGIMGMDDAKAAFWAQMSSKLGIKHQFSLCFSRSPTASRKGTNAGAMTLGGYDDRFHSTPMIFTDVNKGAGFYGVTVRNVYMKKSDSLPNTKENLVSLLGGPNNGRFQNGIKAIVDSGTTDSYFERTLAPVFESTWKDMIGTGYGHGSVKLTDEQLASMPTIVLQIAGNVALNQGLSDLSKDEDIPGLAGVALDSEHPYDVLIHVPSSHYMEYSSKSDSYSARFYTDESTGSSVIGANIMMGHNIFFDIDKHIIGWAQSDCDYEGLTKPFVDSGVLVPNEDAGTTRQQPKKDTPDGGFDSHDAAEPPVDVVIGPSSSFCSSATCKFTSLAVSGMLAVAILMAVLLKKRRRSGRYRAAAASELELQAGLPSTTLSRSSDEEDFGDVQYRDHVPENGSNGGRDGILRTRTSSSDGAPSDTYLVDPDDDEEQQPKGVLS